MAILLKVIEGQEIMVGGVKGILMRTADVQFNAESMDELAADFASTGGISEVINELTHSVTKEDGTEVIVKYNGIGTPIEFEVEPFVPSVKPEETDEQPGTETPLIPTDEIIEHGDDEPDLIRDEEIVKDAPEKSE